VLCALALACGGGESDAVGAGASAPLGPAPDFDLERVRGGRVTLAELRGRTLVIDFWATWCVPCIAAIPELNALHAAYKDRGISVLGVSVDTLEGPELLAWVDDTKKHEPMWYEILRGDIALAERYGAVAFPHTAIVSPEGELLATLEPGNQTQAAIEDVLRAHGRL
jgi:thiol-disulfide isomerase/thioredoxin